MSFLYAPRFLTYSDVPRKAQAVILLISPDTRSRKLQADQLIREGYAEYLIIPAQNRVQKADLNRTLAEVSSVAFPPAGSKKKSKVFENTHLEVAQARLIMESLGLTSAIFVSSPYHMRRIKLVAEKVFSGADSPNRATIKLYFVPTRYETPQMSWWFLKSRDLIFVSSEYAKIAWFFIYSGLGTAHVSWP